jgi:hypothetical protein
MTDDQISRLLEMAARTDENVKTLVEKDNDKETRLRRLERLHWLVIGGSAVATYVVNKLKLVLP